SKSAFPVLFEPKAFAGFSEAITADQMLAVISVYGHSCVGVEDNYLDVPEVLRYFLCRELLEHMLRLNGVSESNIKDWLNLNSFAKKVSVKTELEKLKPLSTNFVQFLAAWCESVSNNERIVNITEEFIDREYGRLIRQTRMQYRKDIETLSKEDPWGSIADRSAYKLGLGRTSKVVSDIEKTEESAQPTLEEKAQSGERGDSEDADTSVMGLDNEEAETDEL
ncbi:MAG: hypothetical protein ACYCOU_02385, partial [Sulfobacillus sp.]